MQWLHKIYHFPNFIWRWNLQVGNPPLYKKDFACNHYIKYTISKLPDHGQNSRDFVLGWNVE